MELLGRLELLLERHPSRWAPFELQLCWEPRGPRWKLVCLKDHGWLPHCGDYFVIFMKFAEATRFCIATPMRRKYASCPTKRSCNSSKASDDSRAQICTTISRKSRPKPFNTQRVRSSSEIEWSIMVISLAKDFRGWMHSIIDRSPR